MTPVVGVVLKKKNLQQFSSMPLFVVFAHGYLVCMGAPQSSLMDPPPPTKKTKTHINNMVQKGTNVNKNGHAQFLGCFSGLGCSYTCLCVMEKKPKGQRCLQGLRPVQGNLRIPCFPRCDLSCTRCKVVTSPTCNKVGRKAPKASKQRLETKCDQREKG